MTDKVVEIPLYETLKSNGAPFSPTTSGAKSLMDLSHVRWEGKYDPQSDDFDFAAFMARYRSEMLRFYPEVPALGVSWKDLTVYGATSSTNFIQNVLTPLYSCFDVSSAFKSKESTPPKQILRNLTGFLEGGEMLLVLGKPGSGCSTFCRSAIGQIGSYSGMDGSILINGIPRQQFTTMYPNDSTYSGEEEFLYPTLTVRQTLEFMAKCRLPPIQEQYRTFDDETTATQRTRLVNLLLRVLGLTKCADTRVGNEFLRGVSGGERKRVGIAEQALAESTLTAYDGSTKGLDSASAYEFAHALRVSCDLAGSTVIASLYQVSEAIYNEFNKVMVLFEGRCIYFGPRNQARAYMESLGFSCPPRQTTADFLTGVTTETEWRQYAVPGANPPKTPDEFEKAWQSSPQYQQLLQDYQVFESKSAQRQHVWEQARLGWSSATKEGIAKPSPNYYPTSLWTQLGALLTRESQILLGDWMRPVTELAFNVVMAIIVGLVYFRLPLTGSGAFNRAGAIFFAVLFLCLSIAAMIEPAFKIRSVFYRQKSFHTYRPSLYYIATLIMDIPYRLVMTIAFSVVFYMMVGLNPLDDYAHFGIYVAINFLLLLAFSALTRAFIICSPSIFTAFQLFCITVMLMVVYCGYLIPPKNAKPWFSWIIWINPIAYAVKGLFVNEYSGLRFYCDTSEMVPPYADAPQAYKTCSIAGSQPGTNYSEGLAWLTASYGDMGTVGTNVVGLIGFWLLYVIVCIIATEFVEFGMAGVTIPVFKKVGTPKVEAPTNDTKVDVKETAQRARPALTWKNLDYIVPVKGGERKLLDNCAGFALPGRLVALMGSSGAGKSTILDVLAQTKTIGKISGSIYFGNEPQDARFKTQSGYCQQQDIHQPTATIREALRFSALLRQPASVSQEEKYAYVEEIVELLGLQSMANAQIGKLETGLGLSVEERKRLTIAVELVAKPDVLFLDEPTSGLDGNTSYTIIQLIRRLADTQGISVICTIHQPSSVLFEAFDDLYLLARGGRLVYFGPIGQNSSTLLDYFARQGAPRLEDPLGNPAEYILDAINARMNDMGQDDWVAAWNASPEAAQLDVKIDEVRASSVSVQSFPGMGWWEKTSLVVKRMFINYWRLPEYNTGRIFLTIFLGLLFGFSYLMVPNTLAGFQSRLFALFMTASISSTFTESVQPQFFDERNVFYREHVTGFYDWASWAIAMAIVEIPYSVVCSTIYFALFYFLVGLNPEPARIAFFWLCNTVYSLWYFTLGQSIAALSPSASIAALMNPFVSSLLGLFAGVTILYDSMPVYLSWVYWINPYQWFLGATFPNDISGVAVTCSPDEYVLFNSPPGKTCGEWSAAFINQSPGYLANPSATSGCQFCPLANGDSLLVALRWPYSQRWLCFGILVVFWLVNVITTLVFIYMRRKGANR